MTNIINYSCGDFQQGGCLYKPTSSSQWTLVHSWTSDRPEKQASAKADLLTFGSGVMTNSLLMELSIGNETHSLTLCVNMAGFGKAGHILALLNYRDIVAICIINITWLKVL